MPKKTYIFSYFEFLIAWRYLRSKRTEGGVSTMTWISLIGIALSVFALIATLSVRSGFRAEFTDTILGANAHVTVYKQPTKDQKGNVYRSIKDYDKLNSLLSSCVIAYKSFNIFSLNHLTASSSGKEPSDAS